MCRISKITNLISLNNNVSHHCNSGLIIARYCIDIEVTP